MSFDDRITTFQADLSSCDDTVILDRWYYSGDCAGLEKENEAELRREVSNKFEVSIRDVLIVGSARLGFTIVQKPNRPTFSHFGNSDIDVAIISRQLFNLYWELTLNHWEDHSDWAKAEKFRLYLFRGWLRPDMLPTGKGFEASDEWFDFFRSLQASGRFGGYKINAGIYYDETFLERYTVSSLQKCRRYIEEGL